jgi:DNA-binding NarL/FixJ family response regulator
MAHQRPPYYFLDKTVSVLIVDDDTGVLSLLSDLLAPMGIYSVQTAHSTGEAEPILASPERIHLCVLDLGLRDQDNDEFYLLRKYSSRVAFVVFTGSTSPAKGFAACAQGAKAIIEKSPEFNPGGFIQKVNTFALLNVINPRYSFNRDTLSNATDILFEHGPKYVSQWALQMGITDRELRHIWTRHLGANAKVILTIYQMFSAAFAYYESTLDGAEDSRGPLKDDGSYRRLEEYFHCHKSTIMDFIAFGNVVNFM